MAPIPPAPTPRIVVYYQTHHTPSGTPISILPLLTTPKTSLTHLIVAAIHLNSPDNITLNDHSPYHPRNQTLWAELSVLQSNGIKVLGMLGGAAKGTFTRLDGSATAFEEYYIPLRNIISSLRFNGLDLDVEESMSLEGIIRLIDRLKLDFGDDFIITLAPVAAALATSDPRFNLSGFDYETLEVMRGHKISWYNAQFYCNWGDMHTTLNYDTIIARGFPSNKVVAGLVTNSENGAGFVPFEILRRVLSSLKETYANGFGGVMGWEFFNSLPGGRERPWEWASFMTMVLDRGPQALIETKKVEGITRVEEKTRVALVDEEEDIREEASLPTSFEYFTDGSADS